MVVSKWNCPSDSSGTESTPVRQDIWCARKKESFWRLLDSWQNDPLDIVKGPSCCAFIHRFAFEEVSWHRVLITTITENQVLIPLICPITVPCLLPNRLIVQPHHKKGVRKQPEKERTVSLHPRLLWRNKAVYHLREAIHGVLICKLENNLRSCKSNVNY